MIIALPVHHVTVYHCGCEALSRLVFPALGLVFQDDFWMSSMCVCVCVKDVLGAAVKHALTLPRECKQRRAVFTTVVESIHAAPLLLLVLIFSVQCEDRRTHVR